MGQVVLQMGVTLDGYVAGPGGQIDGLLQPHIYPNTQPIQGGRSAHHGNKGYEFVPQTSAKRRTSTLIGHANRPGSGSRVRLS
jgi:hypothetical protein